jgi:phosphotransferase family enzyme
MTETRYTVDSALRDILARLDGRTVASLERRPSPCASSHTIEEIDVRFAGGGSLDLVMKDCGQQPADASPPRPAFLNDRQREIRVYQRILPSAPAGTAACYGAVNDTETDTHWLFLERIAGIELRLVGVFGVWERVAAWIGGFHRSFNEAEATQIAAGAELLLLDEAYYRRWMARAREFHAGNPEALRVLDRIDHGSLTRHLIQSRPTIVHGEFYPSNILVGGSGDAARVCPVDWELAALGPAMMDLAALATGWNDVKREALLLAYAGGSITPPQLRQLQLDLDCCRLHLALRMLGWAERWTPPAHHAFDWLAEADRLAHRLASV